MAQRCKAKSKRTGEQCGAWALPGREVCHWHGGRSPRGLAPATQVDSGHIGRVLAREYEHLDAFCEAIRCGELSPAQVRARAVLYAGANAIEEFENGRRWAMESAGYKEKRRVLGPAKARCDTCRHEAAAGWVPIDEPGWVIGKSECGPECRCLIDYRKEG